MKHTLFNLLCMQKFYNMRDLASLNADSDLNLEIGQGHNTKN